VRSAVLRLERIDDTGRLPSSIRQGRSFDRSRQMVPASCLITGGIPYSPSAAALPCEGCCARRLINTAGPDFKETAASGLFLHSQMPALALLRTIRPQPRLSAIGVAADTIRRVQIGKVLAHCNEPKLSFLFSHQGHLPQLQARRRRRDERRCFRLRSDRVAWSYWS